MRTPMETIIPSIVAKLRGDTTLSGLVTGIFDSVPSNQPFPFITISNMSEIPFNTFGKSGRTSTITVNVLSQYQGFKEATVIYGHVNNLLDGSILTLQNHTLVSVSFRQVEFLQDDTVRHIAILYDIITQEA